VLVAEVGARRLQCLSGETDAGRISFAVPGVEHFTCFAYDSRGTLWYPNRPDSEVVELQPEAGTLRRHRFGPGNGGEFTGLCRDLTSKRAMLILDRAAGCLWRLESARYTLAATLPRQYRRLRALRAHGAGAFTYSVIDPPTSTVLWLDERLRLKEVWRGRALPQRTIARTALSERGGCVDVVDNLGTLWLQGAGRTAAIPLRGQPRDLRMLGSEGLLLVLRDAHRVVWLDSNLRQRASYGGSKHLLYPCSADVNPHRQTVVVVDPLRARLVEFARDGRVRACVPTSGTYVRWVRCCADGTTWIIDVAKQQLLLFGADWTLWKTLAAPSALDLSDVNRAESRPPGGLLVGGPRVGEWMISPESMLQLADKQMNA
jgi:hypothetical protein